MVVYDAQAQLYALMEDVNRQLQLSVRSHDGHLKKEQATRRTIIDHGPTAARKNDTDDTEDTEEAVASPCTLRMQGSDTASVASEDYPHTQFENVSLIKNLYHHSFCYAYLNPPSSHIMEELCYECDDEVTEPPDMRLKLCLLRRTIYVLRNGQILNVTEVFDFMTER
ncbi:hypothetical protein M7I_3678 [Glarea lozoyensis 74030]|uniref:Uncharacterized protein n=1 Tax=Glarea lozoyensis (strain ATCC 74030 / MF5533) TaxID=1104152 RepID=H0EM51_GLAL7|nr:hypothetical protein M7I_3678 [Glarea lozoyensis 74030]